MSPDGPAHFASPIRFADARIVIGERDSYSQPGWSAMERATAAVAVVRPDRRSRLVICRARTDWCLFSVGVRFEAGQVVAETRRMAISAATPAAGLRAMKR